MAAATDQGQHPKIGDEETGRMPEEVGVKEMEQGPAEKLFEKKVCVFSVTKENVRPPLKTFHFVYKSDIYIFVEERHLLYTGLR